MVAGSQEERVAGRTPSRALRQPWQFLCCLVFGLVSVLCLEERVYRTLIKDIRVSVYTHPEMAGLTTTLPVVR